MESDVHLTLKGVGPEAIEVAREAARRCGLSLGQWLNAAIMDSAAGTGVAPARATGARDGVRLRDEPITAATERLGQLAERIDRLARGAAHSPPAERPGGDLDTVLRALEARVAALAPGPRASRDPDGHDLAETVDRLSSRLDQLMTRHTSAAPDQRRTAPERRAPARDLSGARTEPAPRAERSPPALPATARLIEANRAAAEQARSPLNGTAKTPGGDRRPQAGADLSGLEQQLRQIADQIKTLRHPETAPAAPPPRGDVVDLARSTPRRSPSEIRAAPRPAPEAEPSRRESEGPGLASLERGLAEMREALRKLVPGERTAGLDIGLKELSHKVDLLAGRDEGEAMRQLDTAISELRPRLTASASPTSASAAPAKADPGTGRSGEISEMGSKVYRSMTADPDNQTRVQALAQRIEALARSASNHAALSGAAVHPQVKSAIRALTDRLETAPRTEADNLRLETLETQLSRLEEKLDALESEPGEFDRMRRALADVATQWRVGRATAGEPREPSRDRLLRQR
jgi:localization factor PodJL